MMETISYGNIKVEGFPFRRIRSIWINHQVNEHGIAQIKGEVDSEEAQGLVQRVDETLRVSITTTAKEQPGKLFYGCVKEISLSQESGYSIVSLTLYTTSRILDMQKKKKTYKQVSQTYGQIIKEGIADKGELNMTVSDKATNQFVMKYDETEWEFAKRMASRLQAPLVADIKSEKPLLYVGLPTPSKTITIKSKAFSYGSQVDSHAQLSNTMVQDFSGEEVESYAYAFIGDKVSINGKAACIKGVDAVLTDGILQMRYTLMQANGSVVGIAVPETHSKTSGKMMKGTVKEVNKDKVKVNFKEIDDDSDPGGDWWFPFSTAYSSSDGSGWYCMPEVGDEVRVFFPSGEEADAFAASTVFTEAPKDPKHKSWKAPGGKEILLTDEGLYVIGKAGKIYINLTDEKGVEIYSDKEINVMSDTKVSICADNEVHIVAKNEIIIGTEEAYIDLDKNTATLAASEVLIN